MRTKLWTTENGTKIRIMDLGDTHLINILNFLERKARAQWVECLDNYPSFNGEMAQYYAEAEWNNLSRQGPSVLLPDIYSELIAEAEHRKLDWKSTLQSTIK